MDMTNDPLLNDFDSLANGEPSNGGGGQQFAPGRYLAKLVSCKSVPKRDNPQKTTPTTELRIFSVLESENPNAQADFAGKVYKAFNSFQTGTPELDKNNRMAIAKLIDACGKAEAWKGYVALVQSPAGKASGLSLNEASICNWISNNCADNQIVLVLKAQYMSDKKKAANAELIAQGKEPKVYLDHFFEKIPGNDSVNSAAAQPTTTNTTTAPFGMA